MAKKLPDEVLDYFRKQGSKGGKLGGKVRASKLTPEERSAIARKAGLAGGRGRKKAE